MRTNTMKIEALETFSVRLACGFASSALVLFLLGLLLLVGFAKSSFAQEAQPKTFGSPGEATSALFEATQKEDERTLEAILGAGKEVTSSSDEIEDKWSASSSPRNIRRCTAWSENLTEARCCTSA
jgi:hypothetical protein